jgi:hypothetical protein
MKSKVKILPNRILAELSGRNRRVQLVQQYNNMSLGQKDAKF